MAIDNRVSTGLSGLDQVIDMLRLGDNVVWQVDSLQDYLQVVRPYVEQARKDGRRLVYFRFGVHEPLMAEDEVSVLYKVDATSGFESFATKIHDIIEKEGLKAFYVFDSLSDLLKFWYSDLMIGNFFRVTCPFLYQLDTVAYFALIRGVHTHATIARIRETTQLLLDIYGIDEKIYVHPLKVWERYTPAMFFPHLIEGEKAVSVTASADAAALFSGLGLRRQTRDYWEITLERAYAALTEDEETQSRMKKLLTSLIISRDSNIAGLADSHLTLRDILDIASREIGTGFIGGKSVGMLLARKILRKTAWDVLQNHWEPHDSYYLGSDIFYTYIVQNGWWELRTKQKTPEGYFALAPELRGNLLKGKFPDTIREQFMQMLEHYGQSPIIVRSSSLLEDNFGNAFAGKYESVFCANQGSPEERFEAFEQAVRTVYASTMSDNALAYRQSRGLADMDEQMAILVQRVSGDHYDDLFFPHVAGVGNSFNLYVWDKEMTPEAGMLRLVFGLGTRAVDRVSGDYARIVPLDRPLKGPPVAYGDEVKFAQHKADVLNLRENRLTETPLESLRARDLRTDKSLFFSVDSATLERLREMGRDDRTPEIPDFRKLLGETAFPATIRAILSTLQATYDYPVDIEFTANFTPEGDFRINLLQCRPLQTKGLGKAVSIPEPERENIFFSSIGNFMGGNVRLPLDYVVLVKAKEYLELPEREKYQAARLIGALNQKLKGNSVMLAGPGRWGTTTPSLGVPVHFSELGNMAVLGEVSYRQAGVMPELSFGSHFFQDIVESGIFYAAIFEGEEGVAFNPEFVLDRENLLESLLGEKEKGWEGVIHVARTPGLILYADITSQRVLCSSSRVE
ncbi:MAG: PEP/pyruvate-binding domain-containing protein [Zoogloeaceae bacterium]|jgi:KaiC/GvpD/RAD55 family RecA-like ATPase|nr:PEP/pyruvate-binding domain-containing protein [Zoogloeaceae bacterium]